VLTSPIHDGEACEIRLPVALLDQMGLGVEVEFPTDEGPVITQPEPGLRRRWEEALASLADCVQDLASLGEIPDLPRVRAS
jgi:hypothetical protein